MIDLVVLARNPIPSGGVVGTFAGHDEINLRFARWDATRSPRRGTMVVMPGRCEPIEKYFEVIADLRRRGFAVAIHDWRGQGGSQRLLSDSAKGHVIDFADYDADLTCFMREVVLPDCPAPYFALGHSMGGNILLRNAINGGSWFDRMILTAPMLAISDSKMPVPQRLVRLYAKALGFGRTGENYVWGGSPLPAEAKGFENNHLTSDPDRFIRNRQILEARPDLIVGSPTISWLKAAYRSMDAIMAPDFGSRVRVPMLLVVAGQDRIVSSNAIERFAGRLKMGARVVLGGARHEILQETDDIRMGFWTAFDAYMSSA